MSLKKFLLSKELFKNFGLAIVIAAGILFITLLWLSIFTKHGQARPVPDFYGLTIEDSQKLAKKKRLKIHIIDSVYTKIVPRGCVVEQNPITDHKVKKNRRVVLTINAFSPEFVIMPDLVGLSARQAYSLIESTGLEAGNPVYRPDLTIDFVLDQMFEDESIESGDSIQKGSEVILVLGKGLSSRRTQIPDLTGNSFARAKSRILGSSLLVGTYNFDSTVKTEEDSISAFVYKQNPQYKDDATIQFGSAVYIWLSNDSTLLPVDSSLIDLSDTLSIDFNSSVELN
jgi:beta-lactam-binding protein with PASTA domain